MAKVSKTHGKYSGCIVSITDMRKLKADLKDKAKSDITNFIVTRFKQIGEEAVRIARETGDYNDITGNLRSSIGYIIMVDGRTVTDGKQKQYSGPKGDGSAGVKAGKELLDKLKAKFPYGIVLILCAGMEYASFVENVRGKNVLVSATHVAESLADKLIGKLLEKR